MFDFSAALLGIVVLSPVFLVLAILVRLNMGSPVFFKHERAGYRGEPFFVYKFRTMTNARDSEGKLLPNLDRLTPLGNNLRKWSLDEIPQLFNVLKGDLSLVGPRPLLIEYLPLYNPEQARRHLIKPGITGWAQVNGRNAISWEQKFKLDVWYVDHQSFFLDLKILLMTVQKVIQKEGVKIKPGKFRGQGA
ncbi:MAG: sugar transferase [Nitrospinales bacterium]